MAKPIGRAGRIARNMARAVARAGLGADTEPLHFLHIGKCAGSQIGEIATRLNASGPRTRIVLHGHDVALHDLPRGEAYFFSVRDPVSRFYSGFYSRKRKGRPRMFHEWSDHDRRAFEDFEHANDLAESLFAEGEQGRRAFGAMKSIRHAAQNQSDWFCRTGNFLALRPPVWIIRQERFDEDLATFLARAGLDPDAAPGAGEAMPRAHRTDYTGLPPLSEKAKDNLRRWYVQDYALIESCVAWMSAALSTPADKRRSAAEPQRGS